MMLGTSRTPASPGGSFTSLRDRFRRCWSTSAAAFTIS